MSILRQYSRLANKLYSNSKTAITNATTIREKHWLLRKNKMLRLLPRVLVKRLLSGEHYEEIFSSRRTYLSQRTFYTILVNDVFNVELVNMKGMNLKLFDDTIIKDVQRDGVDSFSFDVNYYFSINGVLTVRFVRPGNRQYVILGSVKSIYIY